MPKTAALKKITVRTVMTALLLAVIYYVGRELATNIASIEWDRIRFHGGYLAGGIFCMFAATTLATAAFRMLLSHLTTPPNWPATFGIAWLTRLGKFIPGKAASVVGMFYLLRRYRVSVEHSGCAALLDNALVVVVGLLLSCPLLLGESVQSLMPHGRILFAVTLAAGLVCLSPKVLLGLINFALRRLGRPTLTRFPRPRNYLTPLGLYITEWLFFGLSLWMLLRSLTPDTPLSALGLCISATAFAMTAGFLALFAPGGLGVREGLLLLLLKDIADPAVISVVVIVNRLGMTLLEVLLAMIGAALLKRFPPSDEDESITKERAKEYSPA